VAAEFRKYKGDEKSWADTGEGTGGDTPFVPCAMLSRGYHRTRERCTARVRG